MSIFTKLLSKIDLFLMYPDKAMMSYRHHKDTNESQLYIDIVDLCNQELNDLCCKLYFNPLHHTLLTSFATNKFIFNLGNHLDYITNNQLPKPPNDIFMSGDYITNPNCMCSSLRDFKIGQSNFRSFYQLLDDERCFKYNLDQLIKIVEEYGYFNIIVDLQDGPNIHYNSVPNSLVGSSSCCNYSYLYPINVKTPDNQLFLYNALFQWCQSLYNPYSTSHSQTNLFHELPIFEFLYYYLSKEYTMNYEGYVRYVQFTKTLMDDIVVTIFTDKEQFVGGFYCNEVIETFNTPVMFNIYDSPINFEYLKLFNIPIYQQ
jgi:hypothetical protein